GHTRDMTSQLDYLHVLLQIAAETGVQNLPLAWLQSVDDRWNGTDVIGHTEKDELLVDKVRVGDLFHRVVQEGSGPVLTQPFLSLISFLFGECKINELGFI